MATPSLPRSPVLTLGKGTRINCASQKMARKMTAAFTAIGVAVGAVPPVKGEQPAIRVLAPVEVHFERPV